MNPFRCKDKSDNKTDNKVTKQLPIISYPDDPELQSFLEELILVRSDDYVNFYMRNRFTNEIRIISRPAFTLPTSKKERKKWIKRWRTSEYEFFFDNLIIDKNKKRLSFIKNTSLPTNK